MSRQIISTTRADGTRSTYALQPGSTVPMQLEALKPLKPSRIKADRRGYPKYKPGMSTAEYVRLYEVGNGGNMKCAEFWQPLNTAPAAGYVGIDTVEHGDFDLITDDAPASPDVAELAPVAPSEPEPEPVADAVPAELAPAAVPVALQVVAAAASGQPGAETLAEAEALALACLARYGQSHPAACAHLASFSAWHRAALAQIRAAAAPEPAAAGAPAADPAPWRGPDNAAARARVHAVHVRTARTAAAVAPNWHADGARMRRSVNAPGFDAASRQLRAAVAAALRAERAAAAQIRAALATPTPAADPAPADAAALACNLGSLRAMHAELSAELLRLQRSKERGAGAMVGRGWPACTMSTRPGGIAARVRRPGADPGPPPVAQSAHQTRARAAGLARSRLVSAWAGASPVATLAQ